MEKAFDYQLHNERVKVVWNSYHKGAPVKVPLTLGICPVWMMKNKTVNPENMAVKELFLNPEAMWEYMFRIEDFRRHYIMEDSEKGLPQEGWEVALDYGNFVEAAWYGAEVVFHDTQIAPSTMPFLNDDNKNMLFEKGIPDPFSGFLETIKNRFEYYLETKKGFTYKGMPVKKVMPTWTCISTDGPFTVACNIRGADSICMDLVLDPDYAHQLLDYITESIIIKVKAWRKYIKETVGVDLSTGFGMGDDSIVLLSNQMYENDIMPYHKRIYDELANGGDRGIHLCGDSSRFFGTLMENVGVKFFDTGFPINHAKMCEQLGPDFQMNGGAYITSLQSGNRSQIEEELDREVRRILKSGINKRFCLTGGNTTSPGTPPDYFRQIYAISMECAYKPDELPGYRDFVKA